MAHHTPCVLEMNPPRIGGIESVIAHEKFAFPCAPYCIAPSLPQFESPPPCNSLLLKARPGLFDPHLRAQGQEDDIVDLGAKRRPRLSDDMSAVAAQTHPLVIILQIVHVLLSDKPALELFETAVATLNPPVAVIKVRSAVHAALANVYHPTNIPPCRLIGSQRFELPTRQDFEDQLIKLLSPTLALSPSSRIRPSTRDIRVTDHRKTLAVSTTTVGTDIESGLRDRGAASLCIPVYNGLAAGFHSKPRQWNGFLTGPLSGSLFLSLTCLFFWYKFFALQNVTMCIGPVAHFHENDSAIKPCANKPATHHDQDAWARLEGKPRDRARPVDRAAQEGDADMRAQGGTRTIFVNDDGMRSGTSQSSSRARSWATAGFPAGASGWGRAPAFPHRMNLGSNGFGGDRQLHARGEVWDAVPELRKGVGEDLEECPLNMAIDEMYETERKHHRLLTGHCTVAERVPDSRDSATRVGTCKKRLAEEVSIVSCLLRAFKRTAAPEQSWRKGWLVFGRVELFAFSFNFQNVESTMEPDMPASSQELGGREWMMMFVLNVLPENMRLPGICREIISGCHANQPALLLSSHSAFKCVLKYGGSTANQALLVSLDVFRPSFYREHPPLAVGSFNLVSLHLQAGNFLVTFVLNNPPSCRAMPILPTNFFEGALLLPATSSRHSFALSFIMTKADPISNDGFTRCLQEIEEWYATNRPTAFPQFQQPDIRDATVSNSHLVRSGYEFIGDRVAYRMVGVVLMETIPDRIHLFNVNIPPLCIIFFNLLYQIILSALTCNTAMGLFMAAHRFHARTADKGGGDTFETVFGGLLRDHIQDDLQEFFRRLCVPLIHRCVSALVCGKRRRGDDEDGKVGDGSLGSERATKRVRQGDSLPMLVTAHGPKLQNALVSPAPPPTDGPFTSPDCMAELACLFDLLTHAATTYPPSNPSQAKAPSVSALKNIRRVLLPLNTAGGTVVSAPRPIRSTKNKENLLV
ncbi:hypothetical protein B0H11DRAFT_1931905 [Mycena galericulata]|nr:hypothetical protein B0H11DRAFT_1931905 [Mycena galericulata]